MQKQLLVAKMAGLERVGLGKVFYLEEEQGKKPEQDQPSRAQDFVPPGWMSSWGTRSLHHPSCAPLGSGWAVMDRQHGGYPGDLGLRSMSPWLNSRPTAH